MVFSNRFLACNYLKTANLYIYRGILIDVSAFNCCCSNLYTPNRNKSQAVIFNLGQFAFLI